MLIGNKNFDDKNTHIMGILNVTPDSFFDGGMTMSVNQALIKTEKMINEGAVIIDVGGESTRPGYTKISDSEEINRVVPVIKAIRQRFDVSISVDTYKSQVAQEAIYAGADIVNDIWGLKFDSRMADVIKKSNSSVCIMHNRNNTEYDNFMKDVLTDLGESLSIAEIAGIDKRRIMIDPGVGFVKDTEQNLIVMKNIGALKSLGFPIMLASSNKSVIGNVLGLDKNERLEGTLATTAWAVMNGCSFVRVHQVKENYRVIQMMRAIIGGVYNG